MTFQVESLSLHGGHNISAVTSSILREIFTKKFAEEVSFTGKGSKAVCGIKNSDIYKVIISKDTYKLFYCFNLFSFHLTMIPLPF